MTFAFDLWSAADVQAYAAAILQRLHDGTMPRDRTMPRDGNWPPERIDVFRHSR
jgi:hypothetical protein